MPTAIAVVVLLCAAGGALHLRNQAQSVSATAGAEEPAAQVSNSLPVPDDRAATASSIRRGSGLLPDDVATVQRAAAESRNTGPKSQSRDMPPPPLPPQATRDTPPPLSMATLDTPPPLPQATRDAPPPLPQATRDTPTQSPQPSGVPPTVQSGNSLATPAGALVTPSPPTDRANAVPPSRALEGVVAGVETDAARVLDLAARAVGPDSDDRIRQSARSMRVVTDAPRMPSQAVGRRLNADARAAWERQDIDTALRLQQRAFEANSTDPEIAGNLAFLYLKVKPPQPALARQLALHALAARGRTFPAGRVEDWGTLAVASSLVGREADAIDAMYVMLSTSNNPERACRAARMAVAQYGRPMEAPANAMLSRIRARGEIPGAPSCR